jgi:hypothetical protein
MSAIEGNRLEVGECRLPSSGDSGEESREVRRLWLQRRDCGRDSLLVALLLTLCERALDLDAALRALRFAMFADFALDGGDDGIVRGVGPWRYLPRTRSSSRKKGSRVG